MPRACEPGLTFDLYLDFDETKAEESRPTFICLSLSMSEKQKAGSALDSLADSKDSEELYDKVVGALIVCLKGWRNVTDRDGNPIEFSADGLKSALNLNEGIELIRKVLTAQFVSKEDKKKQE
jgi:hypothetical protein